MLINFFSFNKNLITMNFVINQNVLNVYYKIIFFNAEYWIVYTL